MAFDLDPGADTPWLAFRYVSGEMGPEEAEAFERRLDEDQTAREAVAEAVALAGAIRSLSPVESAGRARSASRPPWIRRHPVLSALGLAAAACAAGLLAAPWARSPRDGAGPVATVERPSGRPSTPSPLVTLAWSEFRQERDAIDREADGLPDLAEGEPAPNPNPETDDAADHGLPRWLLDAASLAGRPGRAGGPDPAPIQEP